MRYRGVRNTQVVVVSVRNVEEVAGVHNTKEVVIGAFATQKWQWEALRTWWWWALRRQ